MPPELAAQAEFEGLAASGGGSDRLRDLYFRLAASPEQLPAASRELVALVLDRAKRIVAHPSRPVDRKLTAYSSQTDGEIALEETLEEAASLDGVGPDELLMEHVEERRVRCVAMLDISSSMAGEKHLLASIAVAVLLLEMRPEDAALHVFSSRAKRLRRLDEKRRIEDTLVDFLRATPRGFTNLEAGLRAGLQEIDRSGRRAVGLLLSDGRSTEGRDPMELARRFPSLVVLHLDGPGGDLEASRALAHAGKGLCLPVEDARELPRRVYEAVRLVLRRSR